MKDIEKIFKGQFEEKENIIKTKIINEIEHKQGLMNLAKNINSDFKIDNNNKDILNKLFNYFTGNIEYCKKVNISLNKGLLILGGVGVGKSLLMQLFKQYTSFLGVNSFQYYTAMEIIDEINISGVEVLEKFNTNKQGRIVRPITCYVDDICSKNEIVNNYGTTINAIEQLINIRYNVFTKYHKLTHFTSNIYPAEMVANYDIRIVDRLKEMCNVIELKGSSRRK